MLTLNASAIAQSAISLVAALSTLEAIREIPGIYADKKISDVAVAKLVLAVVILTLVILMIWWFGTSQSIRTPIHEDHTQPKVSAIR
jgi:uncharacterized membrane protein